MFSACLFDRLTYASQFANKEFSYKIKMALPRTKQIFAQHSVQSMHTRAVNLWTVHIENMPTDNES